MTVWTLTRKTRPIRWVDADGVRRELRPGDPIPDEALAGCPTSRLEAHKGGGEPGGRMLSAPTPPEPPAPAPSPLGASLRGEASLTFDPQGDDG